MLEIRNLKTYFFTDEAVVKAVDGVSLSLKPGEVLGIVGESGCGKSTLALSILRLVSPPGKIVGGEILWKDKNLLKFSEEEMRAVRGGQISMIFQDPFASLNPVITVGEQIAETIRVHQKVDRRAAWGKAVDLLALTRIPEAEKRAREYPHQFSGGMRQRVMIAMALSSNPELLIADEPTTALDVTVQAQILELLKDLQGRLGVGILLIAHNLGVVAQTCDRVMVMQAGRMVEEAPVEILFKEPRHPYTRNLMGAFPRIDVA